MIFNVISAKQFTVKLSARIQKSGRLGFGEQEITSMNLDTNSYIKFLSANPDLPITHIVILRHPDPDAFQVKQSGVYRHLETAQMFDYFDLDYANKTLFLDFIRDATLDNEPGINGGEVYKVKIREKSKRKKGDNADESDE